MAQAFPYTFISCPCSDISRRALTSKRTSRDVDFDQGLQEEETSFDPRHPRSSFSLFPPEHLLYCEECHDIKCPRCITEEIVCSYCPSCLFEVPSSSVKLDYNRCSRNCFTCPICTSQLITTSLGDTTEGPFILSCNYCMWNSLDIGIQFNQPSNLRQQIERVANGGKPQPPYRDPLRKESRDLRKVVFSQHEKPSSQSFRKITSTAETDEESKGSETELLLHPHARFEALKSFYKDQIASSTGDSGFSSTSMDYSSPSSLSRIMSLYSSSGASYRKSKAQQAPMREALTTSEGLLVCSAESKSQSTITPYINTPSQEQLTNQYPLPLGNPDATTLTALRPLSTLLRTKRSKRCSTCKHILVRPEHKPTSIRYRIRLTALSYIPTITLRPVPISGGPRAPGPDGDPNIILQPGKPSQWIMTLRNPMFESLQVSLGSPSITPGKHSHRVTILCPQFDIGKNGDVWDDALNNKSGGVAGMQNRSNNPLGTAASGDNAGEQIAGKVYDQGRNWTSIVIEVIPSFIPRPTGEDAELNEDEDVIEVPIRVRLEWMVGDEEADGERKGKNQRALAGDEEADDGKRELAYWLVLGIGRVAT